MKKIGIFCAGFFIINTALAQTKYVNEFMSIGAGARAFSMAGAQVASVNDVYAGYWNPAGLRTLPSDFQFAAMHSEYLGGLAKYDYLGLAYRLSENKGDIGISIIRLGVDDIPYTINLLQDGTINYANIKTISASDFATYISYSKDLKPKKWKLKDDRSLTLGGNFKIIHRQVGSMATAWGVGVDAALKMQIKRWHIGAVLRDATTTYTGWTFNLTDREKDVFASTQNVIPVSSSEIMNPKLTVGLARVFPIANKLTLNPEMDWDITTDGKRYGNIINAGNFSANTKIGFELAYKGQFFFRGGVGNFQTVKNNSDTTYKTNTTLFSPSLGVGLYINNLTLDYAFSSLNIQSSPLYTHVVSLKLDLRKPKKFRKDTNSKKNVTE